MPDARRPGRLFASPREPMEGHHSPLLFKCWCDPDGDPYSAVTK